MPTLWRQNEFERLCPGRTQWQTPEELKATRLLGDRNNSRSWMKMTLCLLRVLPTSRSKTTSVPPRSRLLKGCRLPKALWLPSCVFLSLNPQQLTLLSSIWGNRSCPERSTEGCVNMTDIQSPLKEDAQEGGGWRSCHMKAMAWNREISNHRESIRLASQSTLTGRITGGRWICSTYNMHLYRDLSMK